MRTTCRVPGRSLFPRKVQQLVAVVLLVGCVLACAPRPSRIIPEGSSPWARFIRQQEAITPLEDFSIRASINYSSPRSKHRVIMRLFGSLHYPLRMDLEAGIGRTISMWREEASLWQAYFPQERRMYTASNAHKGLQRLGFPSPFDLRELAMILQGKLAPLLPDQPVREEEQPAGSQVIFDRTSRIASLLLDATGRVQELRGTTGWQVAFDYPETSPYASSIRMVMNATTRATLRVKSVEPGSLTTDLTMHLPEDTETISLDTPQGRTTKGNRTRDSRAPSPTMN